MTTPEIKNTLPNGPAEEINALTETTRFGLGTLAAATALMFPIFTVPASMMIGAATYVASKPIGQALAPNN